MPSARISEPTGGGLVQQIIDRCSALYHDINLGYVRGWKGRHPGGKAIGCLPVYVPRELIHAAGMLPVGIMGGGDQVEIIRGDACYQSYICHIPRSLMELGLSGKLEVLDGMLCPSICDVIRNLSGMWQISFPEKYVRYFDFPQNFRDEIGGEFYRRELLNFKGELEQLGGRGISDVALRESIRVYNENRRLVERLYDHRSDQPWRVPTCELYLLLRAGNLLEVDEHSRLLETYLERVQGTEREPLDNIRVVVEGVFCEQPPLGLIRALEKAGCYIVDDDLVVISRFIQGDLPTEGDPVQALVDGFLHRSMYSSSKYEGEGSRADLLVEKVRRRKANGVIFAAPSFCDPTLLDRPLFQKALEEAGIPYMGFQYAENTGQFQVMQEQTGTFADSIKLWSEE